MRVGDGFIAFASNDQRYSQCDFIQYIWARINKKNKNFVGLLDGPPGSGKTYSCIRLAKAIDPTFTLLRVAFSIPQVFQMVGQPKKYGLRKGSLIVLEEGGVAASARRFMSTKNVGFNNLLQTFRHKNYGLLMNSPDESFIDSQSRKLIQCKLTTVSIDETNKTCKLSIKFHKKNPITGEYYWDNFRVKKAGGGLVTKKYVHIKMPGKAILKAYEVEKTAYTTKLDQDMMQTLSPITENKEPKSDLNDRQKETLDWLSANPGTAVLEAYKYIETKYKVHSSTAKSDIQRLETFDLVEKRGKQGLRKNLVVKHLDRDTIDSLNMPSISEVSE